MGYCSCGTYYISPAPSKCGRCGAAVVGGCIEGDQFRVTARSARQANTPDVVEVGGMRIEFLSVTDEGDTGNVPMAARR